MSPNPKSEATDSDTESDEEVNPDLFDSHNHDEAQSESDTGTGQASKQPSRLPAATPVQKRRRVTRACDECRRKKIKCDGKQPCTHCQVYTYDCTYDQPSHRRRNPDPQQVELLETRLRRAKHLLESVMPGINLDDPALDDSLPPARLAEEKYRRSAPALSQDSMLESMVQNTGSLDLDDDGYWDFTGHSSGRVFLQKMREQFGSLVGTTDKFCYAMPQREDRWGSKKGTYSPFMGTPSSIQAPSVNELPERECARLLCENALDDASSVLQFVHQPTFWAKFDRVYSISDSALKSEDPKFISLLYAVLAVGALFATAEQSQLRQYGFKNAIEQGSHWYTKARSMIDVADVRDLTSLQSLLWMVIFLQCSAKLSSCYAHIGICLSSALRLGLHRSIDQPFNPVERETRKRTFWCIMKLDIYCSALLGLPRMLNDEDIDQEYPLEVDDEFITTETIRPMPQGRLSLMTGFNAHTRIVSILAKVVKYVYPIKSQQFSKPNTYIVSHARIREIEHDLQEWMEGLPDPLKPNNDTPKGFVRLQHALRMAYAHIQMFLYRPFLHYAGQDTSPPNNDQRAYACGAACVSVSRNIIHLAQEMTKRGLLVGSYWFYMYSTFFAILSLIFYVLENPQNPTSAEILKDAYAGKDTLAILAPQSLSADKCTVYLKDLFSQLDSRLRPVVNNLGSHKRKKSRDAERPSVQVKGSGKSQRALPLSQNRGIPRQGPLHVTNSKDQASDCTPYLENQNAFTSSMAQSTPLSSPPINWTPASAGHGVSDMGAMMFPTNDPFAYPTQPMITLESQQQGRLAESLPSPFYPPSSDINQPHYGHGVTHLPYLASQNLRAEYVGDSGPSAVSAHAVRMAGLDDTWTSSGPNAAFVRPPHPAYDNLFGEDWSGWMPSNHPN